RLPDRPAEPEARNSRLRSAGGGDLPRTVDRRGPARHAPRPARRRNRRRRRVALRSGFPGRGTGRRAARGGRVKSRFIGISGVALLLAAIFAGGAAADDARSVEIVRYDCVTDTTRHEITLFGNGTIRVRDGLIKHEWMGLAELG